MKDHLKENQMEGFKEVSPMGMEEEMEENQITSKRGQRDRQEEEWSIPASVGRREDIPAG